MIAPSTPSGTRSASADRSASSVMPPDATTGRSVAAHTDRSRSRFGPCSMPSLLTSVTTYLLQPSPSRRPRTSNRSPPSCVQPRAASVRPRTSRPTAPRSPCSAVAAAHQAACSRAAVPMLTRRQPVAIAAVSDSSSRMPPLISTWMSSRPTISASSSRLWPRPKAASRSTRWIHSAPRRCQFSAASTGSPNRFSDPATPCTSCTAWPSAMSTAGSSSRWSDMVHLSTLEQEGVQDGSAEQADTQHHRARRPAGHEHPDQHVQCDHQRDRETELPPAAFGQDPGLARVPLGHQSGDGPGARRTTLTLLGLAGACGPDDRRLALALLATASPLLAHSEPLDPLALQPSPGVAGLLGVELRRDERPVLDRSHEPVSPVLGPRDER